MHYELVVGGYGGQGVLLVGDMVARAAFGEGREVTFMPTYGVAMRGGTVNCMVTIADEEIGSPVMDRPNGAIIMNEASLLKFGPMVRAGGAIVANSSMIKTEAAEGLDGVNLVWVPANEIGRDVARSDRAANMVALGAFLRSEPIVQLASVETILREVVFAGKPEVFESNRLALIAGHDYALSSGAGLTEELLK